MRRIRWRLVREQIDMQLKIRTFSFASFSLLILQPFTFSVVGFLLSRAAGYAKPDLIYTVVGGGIMGMWSAIVFTSSYEITGDRRNGMLEMIVGSPTSLETVTAIRNLTNVIGGMVSVLFAFLCAVFIFDYSLEDIQIPGVLISVLILLFAMWSAGFFLTNFFAWSRISGSFVEFLEMPIAILCGFMFPIRVLPGWMQIVSGVFPIRWALDGMNASLAGTIDSVSLGKYCSISLGLSLLCLFATHLLQRKVHDIIRINGELSSI